MSIVPPVLRRVSLVLVSLAVASALIGAAPSGSAAPAPLRPGAGYRLPGGDFVGYYLTRAGVKVYCIDPALRAPSSVSVVPVARYRGMSRRTAAELAYALTTWGNAGTQGQAAVESQVVNTVVGHADAVRRRAAHLPRSVNALVSARVRLMRARSGPYTLAVRTVRAAAPGQTATARAGVWTGTGRGLPGAVVRLHGSANVTVPAAVRTGPHGSTVFRYTVTGPGPVRIDAIAAGLAPPRFVGTHPASGRQRMVSGSAAVSASAHVGFQARLGALAHQYGCTTACDGHPRTTLRACAVPSGYASRLTVQAGPAVQVLEFPASTRTGCRTATLVLADRDQVSAAWTFLGPHGWTSPVPAAGAFVVDCPPVPVVQVALSYDCVQGSLAAAVSAPATHPAVLVVGGAADRRVEVGAGAVARFVTTVRCGVVQAFTVQAGVRRGGGGWNYGPVAQVSTPGPARQP